MLSGSLVHEDSRGNSGLIYPGLAQRMSAGSGIVHAERNDAYRSTRRAQPSRCTSSRCGSGLMRPVAPPSYQQRELALGDLARGWVPIAAGRHAGRRGRAWAAPLDLWASVLPAGTSRPLPDGELLHVYLARGVLDAETIGPLEAGIRFGSPAPTQLKITARAEAEVLVWQMDREGGDLRMSTLRVALAQILSGCRSAGKS